MKGYLGAILFMLFGHMSFSQTTEQSDKNLTENFRVSIVKIDITPDSSQYLHGYGTRKSVGVNDHIYHRILALDDGTTQFYLLSTEICVFSPVEYDRVAAQINDKLM